jgi:hypothetical protein
MAPSSRPPPRPPGSSPWSRPGRPHDGTATADLRTLTSMRPDADGMRQARRTANRFTPIWHLIPGRIR